MKLSRSVGLALGFLASGIQAEPVASEDSIVPGAFIVEFSQESQDANSMVERLRSQGLNVSSRFDFNSRLFRGASLKVDEGETVSAERLARLAGIEIKEIWPVRMFPMPKLEPSSVGARAAADVTKRSLSQRQSDSESEYSTHVMTQVDKLRALDGITGKGIRVGVIDTGIDYRHPALGGCFGEGCPVAYGYDLVGDDFTFGTEPIPDDDPLDIYQAHGTHVAGIIMAQENELGFTGAAPDVTLGMYKVSGRAGYTTSELLVSAFLQAYEDGSDVISCSAGDDSGWATDASGIAVSRIAEAGVAVVVAGGNSGNLGLWQVASPASGLQVAGIGSVDNTVLPTLMTRGFFDASDSGNGSFGWMDSTPVVTETIELPLWIPMNSTNSSSFACTPLPESFPSLQDKFVLLPAISQCPLSTQTENLAAKGAEYILYYSLDPSRLNGIPIYTEGILGTGTITPGQGNAWEKMLRSGEEVTITMVPPTEAGHYVEDLPMGLDAGMLSDFTSWGPTWEGHLKPQFVTPGGWILSTWTYGEGDYAVNPGTSMATPMVAAIYALVGQFRGNLNAQHLRNVLSSTAQPKPWYDGETIHEILAPVPQQGAGLLQAYDAAHVTTLVDVSGFSLNDTDNFVGQHSFQLENTGDTEVTYTLGHARAATAYTFTPGARALEITRFPPAIAEEWASVEYDFDSVTIPAGETAEISFTVTPPTGLNATLLPVYSGYLTIDGTNNETLSVPYVGTAGSIRDTPIFIPDSSVVGLMGVYLSSTANHFLIPVSANMTFTIPRPPATSNALYPKIVAIPTIGSREIQIELFPAGNSGNSTSLGQLSGTPLRDSPSLGWTQNFNGVMGDGSIIGEGAYKFVIRGLRVFGNPDNEDDWDVRESVPFNLRYESS